MIPSARYLWTVCFLSGLLFIVATDQRRPLPGIRVLFTTKGLNYVRKIAVPVIVKRLNNLKIPAVSRKVNFFLGSLNYEFKDIKVSHVKIPDSYLYVRNRTGLFIHAARITIEVSQLWSYEFTCWPFISDSGSCDVSGKGISLDILVRVEKGFEGEPSVSASDCHLHIGDFDIQFHGGASWLYNLFMLFIKDALKEQTEKAICVVTTEAINKQVNAAIRTIPDEETFSTLDMKTNYNLTTPPLFDHAGLEVNFKAEFLNLEHPVHAPYTPHALPPVSGSYPKMLYIWITSYTLNTVAFAYFSNGQRHLVISSDDLPDDIPVKLNTDFFVFIVPPLYTKYPGKDLTIDIRTSKAPLVTLSPGQGYFTWTGTITVYAVLNDKHLANCFTLNAVTTLDIDRIFIFKKGNHSHIGCKITNAKTDISLRESLIGGFNLAALRFTVDVLSQYFVTRYISEYTEQGIPLPLPGNTELIDPVCKIHEDYVFIAASARAVLRQFVVK